jgi:hypothetical protein
MVVNQLHILSVKTFTFTILFFRAILSIPF